MLGNRGTPNFTRTTSMTEFTLDVEAPPPPPVAMTGGDVLSPRYLRQNSPGDYYVQTADFLRCCGLCNCRLAPGRDIFMYRGDTAFCSQECREQQMKQDERKERRAAMKKGESHHPGPGVVTASPEAETVAAA